MTLLISIFGLLANPVFAQNLLLDDLGGPGAKIYDGKNQKAWVFKDCIVTIMGSKNTPVVYFSISDRDSVYGYWTYNSTFATGPGNDQNSVVASDNMNLVNPQDSTKVYANTAKTSGNGISEITFHTTPGTRSLSLVEFNFYDGGLKNEIACGKLQLRPKEPRD